MPSAAFVLTASTGLKPSPTIGSSRFLSSASTLRVARNPTRRARVQANAETDEKKTVAEETASNAPPTMQAPSIDTEVFSKFVESTQAKLDEWGEQIQNVDGEAVLSDAKEASTGLIDNLLAGTWLTRGELYGAIQLALVLFLLRPSFLLDGLITLICGPALLFVGAGISAKSLMDLGRKQLSIWPAPVPDAELKMDGVYEVVRHPMYAGLIMASTGFAVSTHSPTRLAITVALVAFLKKKIEVEEEFLSDTYPEYASYCDKVKNKIFPGIY